MLKMGGEKTVVGKIFDKGHLAKLKAFDPDVSCGGNEAESVGKALGLRQE